MQLCKFVQFIIKLHKLNKYKQRWTQKPLLKLSSCYTGSAVYIYTNIFVRVLRKCSVTNSKSSLTTIAYNKFSFFISLLDDCEKVL